MQPRFNTLLSSARHGFVKKKSPGTNLLECFNDWTLAVQNRQSVIAWPAKSLTQVTNALMQYYAVLHVQILHC